MAETSVILFELLHGWNRVNIDYMNSISNQYSNKSIIKHCQIVIGTKD